MSDHPSVLLIHPTFSTRLHYGKLSRVAPSLLPVSLVYLAAYLEKFHYPVRIYDGQVEELSDGILADRLRRERPDVVGITCMTPMAAEAHHAAKITKEVLPSALTIFGGIHPTILPDETLADPHVDVVVRGEGEMILHELLQENAGRGDLSGISGLSWRRNGAVVHNPDRPPLEDLDALPFPAFHLIPMDKYHQIPDAAFALPLRGLITSRGCPFRCIFCSARLLSGYNYRYRSPDNVLAEMEVLINKYGARQLTLLDDNFVVNRDRTAGICDGMIARGYHQRVVWTCAARADQVDESLLRLMRQAGCKLVSYGVESGTQRLLDLVDKQLQLTQVERAVTWSKRAGLMTRGTFIIGLPTETPEETRRTIEYAKQLGLDLAKFSIATPYPGTPLYQMAKKQGLVDDADWSRFSSMAGFTEYDPVFVPEGREPKELKQMQKLATREFYLRPRQILNLLRNIRSGSDIKMYYYAAQSLLSKGR